MGDNSAFWPISSFAWFYAVRLLHSNVEWKNSSLAEFQLYDKKSFVLKTNL